MYRVLVVMRSPRSDIGGRLGCYRSEVRPVVQVEEAPVTDYFDCALVFNTVYMRQKGDKLE